MSESKAIKHARLELNNDDYEELKRVAKANGLPIAAFIRMAVLQRVRSESAALGGK